MALLKKEHKRNTSSDSEQINSDKPRIRIPWFIVLFLITIVLSSYLPWVHDAGKVVLPVSKKLLSLTLFFIGTGFTKEAVRKVGFRPLLLGLILWVFIGTLSLAFLFLQA
jgi:uncharacterized membrane protein YadS